jgi:hypothetical protein
VERINFNTSFTLPCLLTKKLMRNNKKAWVIRRNNKKDGVRGNEWADRLAGTAVISDGCAIVQWTMLICCTPSVRRVEWKTPLEIKSLTLERLREGHVKLGAASYEHYAGSQRRMVNQIRTGTLSSHTLILTTQKKTSNMLYFCKITRKWCNCHQSFSSCKP